MLKFDKIQRKTIPSRECLDTSLNILILAFFELLKSVLLYGCTTLTLMKRLEKRACRELHKTCVLFWKKFWKQYPTKQLLYAHLAPISETTRKRRTRGAIFSCGPTYKHTGAMSPCRIGVNILDCDIIVNEFET